YLRYTKQEKNKANKQKIDFLDQQLQLTQKQLNDYETYFEDFTITNKTTNVENDINNIIKAINVIDSQKIALQKQQAELSILQEQGLIALKVGQNYNTEIDEGLKKLSQLMDEKELILGSYNENTYAVQKKQQEVDLAKKGLMDQIGHYQKSIEQQFLLLNSQKITLEKNLQKLPSKGTEYSSNARNFSLYEEFLLTLMQLKADFEIAQAGTTNDFIILSAATFPDEPIAPNKLIIHGIGIVAGLFIGIFLVGFRYAFHNKINSHQELEKLTRTPILGTVPFYDKEKMKESKLVIDRYPKSPVSESLRTIRTNMEFLKVTKGKKVLSVTSTVSGEGKTFLAVNLGGIISLSQQKVVIIDMDMRRPKIHKAFNGQDNLKGLSTILINKHGIKECIQESSLSGLDFIPAGPTPPNPSELLLGQEVDTLFAELKKTYDVIILDTPPVGLVTDGILAMKKADLPIYVVRCDYSKRDFIKTLNRLVKTDQFKNLSVILNSLNLGSGRGYGYGYGYGYGKGYYE
ncbi:MAG: polysaccharide biosynthesis tyrosine autokinase, partial [Cyclobacteriaceae bacterium]